MLVTLTQHVTPEGHWVPRKLPRPTRHLVSFFFFAVYTRATLW